MEGDRRRRQRGRAVVYTIWQASHMDQTFFFCSDVNFTR
ncbi:lytic polysaccharide monooxygenase [Microbispora siamensis]